MNGVKIKALLDLGSSANYISGSAALRAGLRPLRKIDPYQLYVANGAEMPQNATVTYDTIATINIKG
jgi:predicted aspartyl protease